MLFAFLLCVHLFVWHVWQISMCHLFCETRLASVQVGGRIEVRIGPHVVGHIVQVY